MGVNFPKLEEEVLKRWRKEKTFERSVAQRRPGKRFVFYEGPPTANAGPGIHHVLSRVFKDIILRYKTMRGFLVERRAGWDTHGLPVELQIEKKLGLKSKKDIETYGIAKFNAECKKSVWEYKKEWEDLTERIGFWLDMKNPYITYETPYIETLWFIIKQFWQKKLLYKDYKVVPYCPRCGTPLSSHEMAQGYKTVKDPAIFVKFEIRNSKFETNPKYQILNTKTYFLVWTTTPWTLPGNVALTVGKNTEYVLAEKGDGRYIVAKALAGKILGEYKVARTFKGKDLLGIRYEPLFRFEKPQKGKKIWEVVPADFISVQKGTGIVHTAVAYGEEDFELGKKENLAMLHLVNEQGKFIDIVKPWKGMFVKNADPLIVEALKKRNLLFKEELYEHEYPFCWRCDTALLYYAKESWFVNMQKVKKQLIQNNESINWIPSHIKKGRMGEWLKEVKDWAFSRERYWGTPLPIWQCNTCNAPEIIGSLRELLQKNFTTNTYYILRHGHSERQITDVMSCWPEKKPFPLTLRGVKQTERVAQEFKKKNIHAIFSSDLLRTKQTAQILGNALGIKPMFDKRLREWDVGTLNGKPVEELGKIWGKPGETKMEHYLRRFVDPLPKGESYSDLQKRMYEFVQEINKQYKNKNIAIISHELPLTLLETTMRGFSREESVRFRQEQKKYMEPGEWRKLPFVQLPLDEGMEINLHRPYVDSVVFSCSKCTRGTMQRIKEVVDVWFDSGAMPFAQGHWPLAQNQNSKFKIQNLTPPKEFPADYIVEGVDQTRGWFYTLLAVSTLLGFKASYKNVITLSHVLDEKGEKMSKSKGNVVNPWEMISKYGIDAVRWYFYTINNPGEPKLFSEKGIQQATRNFVLTLWNCFVFYKTYVQKRHTTYNIRHTKHVLDKWILTRLNGTIQEATEKLDSYDVTGAGRAIQDFVVNDLSLWYIRRSRNRAKETSATLRFVLSETCKLLAPLTPFLSEHIFQELGNKESVHVLNWPKAEMHNIKLETQMAWVRDIVAKALAERAKAGIKVRQPLSLLTIQDTRYKIQKELLGLIKDEVNVRDIQFDTNLKTGSELDTRITPQLKEEGMVRELIRNLQDLRKEAGYKPGEKALLYYEGGGELANILKSKQAQVARKSAIQKFVEGKVSNLDKEKNIAIENSSLWLGITKK